MTLLVRLLALADRVSPPRTAYAHCDLPCGVYDPVQAKVEAESVKAILEKYNASTDEAFKARCLFIKEERAELVKHHLWVLVDGLFQAAAPREVPGAARSFLEGDQDGRRDQALHRRRCSGRPAAPNSRDRPDFLGDQEGLSPKGPAPGCRSAYQVPAAGAA